MTSTRREPRMPVATHHLNCVAGDGLDRNREGVRLLAKYDIDLDRHSDLQRRIARQQQICAECLAVGISFRGDLGNGGAQ
jgi:hypothetical protein